MELIILNDGLYQLIPVTKEILKGIEIISEADCFDVCDILRLKLSGYVDSLNLHVMNDGSGYLLGAFVDDKCYLLCMAKYKGRSVKLNKPSRGDVKKFKVFVKDNRSGRVKKINFGSKTMSIKKNIPARQRSFFARFRPILANVKGQKSLSPVYWAMRSWRKGFKI